MSLLPRFSQRALRVLPPLLLAAACEGTAGTSSKVEHPTAENIPPDAELAHVVTMAAPSREPGDLRSFAERLARSREALAIGVLEGGRHEIFGAVEDIEGDPEGRVMVLDSRYNELRAYGPDGRFEFAFGRPGRGPNEFLSPEAFAADARGRVVVADRNNQLKVFRRNGEGLEYERTIHLQFVPEDFCLLGETLYVQGVHQTENAVVHAFTLSGDRLRSFGEPYRSKNPLVRAQMSDGPLACSEDAGTIVTMFEHLPVVFGYAPTGELRWTTRIADFRPMRITEGFEPDGRPYIQQEGQDGYDMATHMLAIPGGYVLLQITHTGPSNGASGPGEEELRTYLLSAATGEGVYVGDQLPRIYDFAGPFLFAGMNDPFPQVKVLEVGGAGGAQ